MEIPKGRKVQYPKQIITRVTEEMYEEIQAVQAATHATDADIFRLALREFLDRYKRVNARKKKD